MKKGVLLILFLLLVGCSRTYDRPNIVIIGLDAARADQVSEATMPNLMKFERDGFIFKNAITQAPWTLPSFMTMFTGVYPSHHKLTNRYVLTEGLPEVKLSPAIKTLAEMLKAQGYATGGFTGDAGVLGRYGYSRGFDIYVDNITFGGFNGSVPLALQWLSRTREPFFLFVHGYEAHGKYTLPPNFFNNRFNISPARWEYYRNKTIWRRNFSITPEEQAAWLRWDDQKLSLLDQRLKPLLDKLATLDNTIVVVMSDHGEGFYEHKMFDHGPNVYDEVAKVVLMLKLPNRKGMIINDQVGLIDVLPTLMKLTGQKCNQCEARGLFTGGNDQFTETDYLYDFYLRSLRTKDGWKLIYDMAAENWEMYDLDKDPLEQHNVAEEYPTRFKAMKKKVLDFIKS